MKNIIFLIFTLIFSLSYYAQSLTNKNVDELKVMKQEAIDADNFDLAKELSNEIKSRKSIDEKIDEKNKLIEDAVAVEDYEKAELLQKEIDQLKVNKLKVESLEKEKESAIAIEDYDKVIAINKEITALKNNKNLISNTTKTVGSSMKSAPSYVTSTTVLNNYIVAKYGEYQGQSLNDKLSEIKNITIKMTMKMNGQVIDVLSYNKAPNKYAYIVSMGTMALNKQTYNGVVGKSSGMQGSKTITDPKLLAEMRLKSIMHIETKYDELGFKSELLGVEMIEGKDAYKLEITDPNGKTVSEWFDVVTGLKIKTMLSTTNAATGKTSTAISIFSDYRDVEGVKYAYKVKQSAGEQMFDIIVSSVDVNTKIADSTFE